MGCVGQNSGTTFIFLKTSFNMIDESGHCFEGKGE